MNYFLNFFSRKKFIVCNWFPGLLANYSKRAFSWVSWASKVCPWHYWQIKTWRNMVSGFGFKHCWMLFATFNSSRKKGWQCGYHMARWKWWIQFESHDTERTQRTSNVMFLVLACCFSSSFSITDITLIMKTLIVSCRSYSVHKVLIFSVLTWVSGRWLMH